MTYRIRKLANKHGYIKSESNLIRITNLKPKDLKAAKFHSVGSLKLTIFGYPSFESWPGTSLRCYAILHTIAANPG